MFGWLKNVGCGVGLYFLVPTTFMLGLTMCSASTTATGGSFIGNAASSIGSFFGFSGGSTAARAGEVARRQQEKRQR
jgi:hypothetical protein